MAEDREMNHYYENIEEEVVVPRSQPGPMVEEEEEEEFTIDFKNMVAYDKGSAVEGVIAIPAKPEPIPVEGSILPLEQPKIEYVEVEKEKPRTLKDDLLDDVLDTITARAVRNLIEKENKAIDKVYEALTSNRRGFYTDYELEEAILAPLEKRKNELRAAWGYLGKVDYEKIPKWARAEVREYIRKSLSGMCELSEDSK